MLTKKQLVRFFESKWDYITSQLNDLCENWNNDTLHDLRVNIKKAKALTKMVEALTENKKAFKIEAVKELFHCAGDIRSAQLYLETFAEHALNNNELQTAQQDILKNTSKNICDKKDHYVSEIKSIEKSFTRKIESIKNAKIFSYYTDRLHMASENLAHPIHTANLHECRKVLKNLLYPLKIMPAKLLGKLALNEQYIDDLQDAIGKWHDAATTLDVLFTHGLKESVTYQAVEDEEKKLLQSIQELTIGFTRKIKL